MITIAEASIYSTKGEMAYQITYSDGTAIRAVEGASIIRKEWLKDGEWTLVGKAAYVVEHSKKRDAEKIKSAVNEWLATKV